MDRTNDGRIDWTEFLAPALCVSISQNMKYIDTAISTLGDPQKDYISVDDLISKFASDDEEDAKTWKEELLRSEILVDKKDQKWSRGELKKFINKKLDLQPGDMYEAVC